MKGNRRNRICIIGIACLVLFCNGAARADSVAPSGKVKNYINVYEAASSTSPHLGQLHPGQTAPYLGERGPWYIVKWESGQGFVSKRWSTLVPDGATVGSSNVRPIRLGSWNIKKLGHGDATDFPLVAKIIDDNFDVLAIVEVMQKQGGHPGYDALLVQLGPSWAALVTPTPRPNTNDSNSEYYAVAYRVDVARPCSGWTALRYHLDNDGGASGTDADRFAREPAFGCFEANFAAVKPGLDFLLAAYHATWSSGDKPTIRAEAKHLDDVFASMAAAAPSEKDLIIAGDFNLVPSDLAGTVNAADRTQGTGSTLNLSGMVTANLYDHMLVYDEAATTEMQGKATVLDVRSRAASNAEFYRTVSDHLPIVVNMSAAGAD